MSENRHNSLGGADECAAQNYEHLNELSAIELQNELEEKISAMTDVSFNSDEIAAYLTALEKKAPFNLKFDTEASLTAFHERHATLFNERSTIPAIHIKKNRSRWTLARTLTAAALTVMLLGALVAQAAGIDIFGTIAKWTDDIFGFSSGEYAEPSGSDSGPSQNSQYKDLQSALEVYGISTQVVPSWLPAGFELSELTVDPMLSVTTFCAQYANDEAYLVIQIDSLQTAPISEYEKDEGDIIVYECNGINHYIMSNMGTTTAVWTNGMLECSIFGAITQEQIMKIIDSIYER